MLTMLDDPSLYQPLITWILVIGGWLVINDQNNKREDRKETRLAIDIIKKQSFEIVDLSIKYHTRPSHSIHNSREITGLIHDCCREVNYLQLLNFSYRARVLSQFRRSITLENFDPSSHSALPHHSEKLDNIRDARAEIVEALETEFNAKYRTGTLDKLHSYITR